VFAASLLIWEVKGKLKQNAKWVKKKVLIFVLKPPQQSDFI
jgi:hypothetical protein